MTLNKKIEIRVSIEGKIKAETFGIFGPKCIDYVSILEDLLDATATESKFNDDYQRVTDTSIFTQGVSDES